MKKLLLGLGTISLAILPVAAMVSCSTTTPTLDTEATKFTVSLEAKTPATTTTAAVDSITNAADAKAKLTALETLVGKEKLPTIAEGFTFEVKSAMINTKLNTTVDVKIMIAETDSTETVKTKEATLSITKLTATEAPSATLETEAAKFNISKAVKEEMSTLTSAGAVELLDVAIGAPAKLSALETLVGIENVPTLAAGFTFKVTTAIVGINKTTVEVIITVIETNGGLTAIGKFIITGFATPVK